MRRSILIIAFLGMTFPAICQESGKSQGADTALVGALLKEAEIRTKRNVGEAIGLAQQALQTALRTSDNKSRASCYVTLGRLYQQNNDYSAALDNYRAAQPLLREVNEEVMLAVVFKNCGDIYAKRSYFRQAFDSYRDAATIFRKNGLLTSLNECQEALGSLTLEFGQPRNALSLFRRSLVVKQTLGDRKGILQTSSQISKILFSLKEYDSALYFIHEVQKLAGQDPFLLTDAAIDEMLVYSFEGKLAEAAAAKDRAETLVAAGQNPSLHMKLLAALSTYFLARQDKQQSARYFDSASVMIQQTRSVELAVSGLSMLAEMSYQNGDLPTAYRMLKTMDRYKDIFRNENIERVSAEIKNAAEAGLREKEYEYLDKTNRLNGEKLRKETLLRLALFRQNLLIDSSLEQQRLLTATKESESTLRAGQLEKERELRQGIIRESELKQRLLADERRNKALLWAGIIISTLLALTIFVLYRRQSAKNAIIRKQSAELEVLNREIHHRVKNNLQVISSLLDLQSQSLHDEKATAIIKEAIQRVQSMAFIHQNLYQGQAVNAVNMQAYIEMLSSHLFQTYNIRPEKIHFKSSIDDLLLHTDSAIPLGMIINELISNSLKYAFRSRETGSIEVEMHRIGQELMVRVQDDGEGVPEGFDPEKSSSFGYEIIKAFCQKLKARLTVQRNNGTDVRIIITKFKSIS